MGDDDRDADVRRNLRLRWFSSIREFADVEQQRRAWLDPNQANPHWSFVECMCCYFDDLALGSPPYASWVQDGYATAPELQAVANFHAVVAAYDAPGDADYDHPAILSDPKWHSVVQAARTAQQRLADLVTDVDERSALLAGKG